MRINDFEKMQQDIELMKNNLDILKNNEPKIEYVKSDKPRRNRYAAKKQLNNSTIIKLINEEKMIATITVCILAVTLIFSTSIFAKTISENTIIEENVIQEEVNYNNEIVLENNENVIQLEDILLENVSVLKSKEYAEEIRPVDFEVQYNDNPNLPEGEEVIIEEGQAGTKQVTVIKSYENNVFVSENILDFVVLEEPKPKIIDIGTSKFLSNTKAHLGDTMYVTEEISLMDNSRNYVNEICTILEYLDVTLKELDGEDWCIVEYDGLIGYLKTEFLTTSVATPEIVDKNRVQKIKMNLSEDIPLNKSTELTLEDYKKVLSNNSSDKNKIIEENAEVFYNMDKTYNMNGIFLASIAIHESAWGTSTIAKDKKNLFGYGAYDSSPYASSYLFDTYAEGIELVAKMLVKNYINEEGTPIYDGEVAKAPFYNGSTVADVNVRYASDKEWHKKVYKYMEYLYNRL